MKKRTVVIIPVVLAGVLLIGLGMWHHYALKGELRDYLKQLKAAGEKTTVAELVPARNTNRLNGGLAILACSEELRRFGGQGPLPLMTRLESGGVLCLHRQPVLQTQQTNDAWPAARGWVEAQRPAINRIISAVQAPAFSFRVDYKKGFSAEFPHLVTLNQAAQLLYAAAILDLHSTQFSQAHAELCAAAKLGHVWQGEPALISHEHRVRVTELALGAFWEALQCGCWTDGQLHEWQRIWESVDLAGSLPSGIEMDRVWTVRGLDEMRHTYAVTCLCGEHDSRNPISAFCNIAKDSVSDPKGTGRDLLDRFPRYWAWCWWRSYVDERLVWQGRQECIEGARLMAKGAAFNEAEKVMRRSEARIRAEASTGIMGSIVSTELVLHVAQRTALAEAGRRLLIAAIALERHRLSAGKLPDALDALVPVFVADVPRDPMDGMPLRYRLHEDGSYLLYSVGLNFTDEGGDASREKQKRYSSIRWLARQDAVWPMPATDPEVIAYFDKIEAQRLKDEADRLRSPLEMDAAFRARYALPPQGIEP
jgi:hypothetical protein